MERNDFVGEILTGKGTAKKAELHERIIKYLKVATAMEPASAGTDGRVLQRLEPVASLATDLAVGSAVNTNTASLTTRKRRRTK